MLGNRGRGDPNHAREAAGVAAKEFNLNLTPQQCKLNVKGKENDFTFDAFLQPGCTQREVYGAVAEATIQ